MRDKDHVLPLTRDLVYKEFEEAMLKTALFEMQEQEAEQLQVEIAHDMGTDAGADLDRLVKKSNARVCQTIRREVRRQHVRHFTVSTLPKIGKVAAVLLLAFFIGLTTAVATIQSVRVKVLEIIFNIEKEYTEVSLREKEGASFEVPAGWQGEYYPAYMPEGLLQKQVVDGIGIKIILFQSADGKRYKFMECNEETVGNIDTEDALIQFTLINGQPGIVAEKEGKTIVSWSVFNKYFVLTCDATADTALQIANSVVRIK